MANQLRILSCLILLLALLSLSTQPLLAAPSAQFVSNQFTQPDEINTDWEINQEIPDSYALVDENETFQLYANRESLAFKVVDKRSGYVWHSGLDEVTDEDDLNRTWTAFAQSGISIDFLDQKAGDTRASITRADHTLEFAEIEQGFSGTVTFTEPGITLTVTVQLEPDGVRVDVPYESVKETNPEFKLGLLYVYPFLGATREAEVPGYMFLPDGSGSLIRFAPHTKAANMFYGRYYGVDLGMTTVIAYDARLNRPHKISVPVFGMVHGYKQNAFLSLVEKGASYGEIQAHPAGVITKWNFLYNTFIYNQAYFQATNRSGAGVTVLQRNTNAFDVSLHYRFLTGDDADYVGMARSYQKYLVDRGDLKPAAEVSSDIGIKLEFLGAEKEKVLFWHRVIPMTTVNQMRDILADLQVKQPEVVLYGWQPLGASTMPPERFKLEPGLGSASDLRALAETVTQQGGNFALYLDPQAAFYQEKGYSPRYDLAMSITNSNLIGYNRHIVNYFFNLDALTRRFGPFSSQVTGEHGFGLALDGIGTNVYSDFKNGNLLTREQAIQAYRDLLKDTSAGFYIPNDYAFSAMRAYYDIPLNSSGYIFTTDTVPFLPIVFAGHVPTYGPALNFSSSLQDDLLRHVDFGAYPSYFLTQDVTAKILNTRSSWIYTSSVGQWGEEVESTYAWLNALLGPVKGQPIVARDVLAKGVVAVTYANGKQIIVNYTNAGFTTVDFTVDAKDAIIREVQP